MTIVEFLLARIGEDEAQARVMWGERVGRRAVGREVRYNWPSPDRTLAECEAKRRIVENLGPAVFDVWKPRPGHSVDDWVLCTLAAVYADHPDYDQAWALDERAS